MSRQPRNTVVGTVQSAIIDRRHELVRLGGIFAGMFLLASLIGFDDADPTWIHPGPGEVRNPCGVLGANLADALYVAFGAGAWAVLGLVVAPLVSLAGRKVATLLQWLLAAWCGWMLLGMAEMAFGTELATTYRPGGELGQVLADALRGLAGTVGAWLALFAAAVSAGSMLFELSWRPVAQAAVSRVDSARPKVAAGASAAGHAVWSGGWGGVRWFGAHVRLGFRVIWEGTIEAARRLSYRISGFSVRMWRSITRRHEMHPDDDDWSVVTGLSGLEPSTGGVPEFRLPPLTQGAGAHPAEAEVQWQATAPSLVDAVLDLFPEFGPRGGARSPQPTGFSPLRAQGRPMISLSGQGDHEPATVVARTPPPFLQAADREVSGRRRDVTLDAAPPYPPTHTFAPPSTANTFAPSSTATTMGDPTAFEAVPSASQRGDRPPTAAAVAPSMAAVMAAPHTPPVKRAMNTIVPAYEPAHEAPNFAEEEVVVQQAEGLDAVVADDGCALVENSLYFELPPLSLLDVVPEQTASFDAGELRQLALTVEEKLASFKVTGKVTNVRVGPVVTTFEFLPDAGISVRRISNLQDDLAMGLHATSVRVVAPIPGKGVVGIEVPSAKRMTIYLRQMLASPEFRKSTAALPVILGKDVEGQAVVEDLAKMPHLLVGGTTGSGKSVGVNGMLMSLLFRMSPEELRLLLVDPKKLEFEAYADIPHLLHPVVTEPKGASAALAWACREMDRRYELLARWKTRNISNYNSKVERESRNWTRAKAVQFAPKQWSEGDPLPKPELLPYIVIVIDELADLMMTAKKEVQESIVRLAQMARACGMHLIIATQRPSVDVITGLIKSNLPTRIAFKLRSVVDSRTILDQGGAEKLLGMGDMLHLPGAGEVGRCHGAFVSDDEVARVTEFIKAQRAPDYVANIMADMDDDDDGLVEIEDMDPLYDDACTLVVDAGKASTSMIQRHLKIGYNRAARIIDTMELMGLVGPADGARPREVLVGQNAG